MPPDPPYGWIAFGASIFFPPAYTFTLCPPLPTIQPNVFKSPEICLQRLPLTCALKGFFRRVQTCVLVDVNQPLSWFFTRWPRADSFPVSRALGRTCPRLSRFCNILLQDPAQLHVKITRSTNLLSVCRRKLKLSPYTHCKLQQHKLSQCPFATRLSSCQFWILFDNMKNDKQICRLQNSFSKTACIHRKLSPLSV